MEKRYQIFISSTFSDLKEERNKVMQTIMSLDCIPAGMELFPAMDEEQFEFIKRIIDDCDYYILIIGARYGSMDENGVSYTEKEYEYAISKNIPVMAFLHDDISSLPINKADLDDKLREKLDGFRKKVETKRLVQYWKNADDLNAKVAVSLPKTIKMFPRTEWVRANLQSNAETLQEITQLQKELSKLREFKAKQDIDKSILEKSIDKIAELDTMISISGKNKYYDYLQHKNIVTKWNVQLSVKYVFENLALCMIDESISETQAKNRIAEIAYESIGRYLENNEKSQIDLKAYQQIRLHLKLLELIELNVITGSKTIRWQLTPKGRNIILKSLCILKSTTKDIKKKS